MEERFARIIGNLTKLEELSQFEVNLRDKDRLTDAVKSAIKERSTALARAMVAKEIGLDFAHLTPAEEKIVKAVSEYVGIKKRAGSNANRTLSQIRNRGLIGAAEEAVAKAKPTQGYTELTDANLEELSYEQIIIDHPEEFSARALWFSNRTRGIANQSEKPPAKGASLTQVRTEALLGWFRKKSEENGRIPSFTNLDSATALGMGDLHQYGRVLGNIQSRIDFACYLAGLPPLGLAADAPFADAWSQQDRQWAFPIPTMQAAARSHLWRASEFDRILAESQKLSGLAHISWKAELAANEAGVKTWALSLKEENESSESIDEPDRQAARRNPPWSRNELILALDLYLRFRDALPGHASPEVAALSNLLGKMGRASGQTEESYRNANGVYMKMMNFRRFDKRYTIEGKVGLTRGNKEEVNIWAEFADDPVRLAAVVAAIRSEFESEPTSKAETPEAPYWVFVCNPKKWAVDRFLDRSIEHDTWGVRPSDRDRFAPGQLGIVRVGVDRRSAAERDGKLPLGAGIYALCEVESAAFDGSGARDEFWAPGEAREPGWPTVRLRYLRTFLEQPLTIARLRAESPDLSPLLLNGFQAASFPLSGDDFRRVVALLGGEPVDNLIPPAEAAHIAGDKLAELEQKYLKAAPEVKRKLSKVIERGQIGALVKRATGFKCQVCEALGHEAIGFLKRSGEPYV